MAIRDDLDGGLFAISSLWMRKMKERKRKDKQMEENRRPDKQSGVIVQVLIWLVRAGGMLALLLYAACICVRSRDATICSELGVANSQARAMARRQESRPAKRSRSDAKNPKESSHTPTNGIGQLSTPTPTSQLLAWPMVHARKPVSGQLSLGDVPRGRKSFPTGGETCTPLASYFPPLY